LIAYTLLINRISFSAFAGLKQKPVIKDLTLFGKRLRKMRETRGLSQESLGLLIDSYQSTIIRIEQGKTNPKLTTLVALAGALEVPLRELVDF
jgi:DNA-binding XRE family transcriptional regulator